MRTVIFTHEEDKDQTEASVTYDVNTDDEAIDLFCANFDTAYILLRIDPY